MSSVVAIAGGTGSLGRALLDALKADNRYTPLVIARKSTPELEKKLGVRILAADYHNIDSLVTLLEDNNIDTVISTIHAQMDDAPVLNIIHAAETSKATRRFIANIWSGVVVSRELHENHPLMSIKVKQQDLLEKTNLEWTGIYPGIFLDYFAPGVPSHVDRVAISVDVEANVAGIPDTGDFAVCFTHTADVGKYTVAALGLKKWERNYFIAGDTKTWNELLAIAEQVKGVKFEVTYDSKEKLASGQLTELPGHKAAYEAFGGEAVKPMVQAAFAQFSLWLANGLGKPKPGAGGVLNEMFPEIKPLGVEEGLKRSYGK